MIEDLERLPPERRARVERLIARETAAVRIREVYPLFNSRFVTQIAEVETAHELRRQGFGFVTARFVKSVMRERR